MLTWTTYGTWLQGDARRYVKNGEILNPDESLAESNRQRLTKEPVKLTLSQCKVIEEAIRAKAGAIGQEVYAISVGSNHVHIVVGYTTKDLGLVVRYYKMAAQKALRNTGFTGRLWTKGFDKRFCFDEQILRRRTNYVKTHNKPKRVKK